MRLLRTITHLKPQQLAGQLWMRGRSLWRPWVRRHIRPSSPLEPCSVQPGWWSPQAEDAPLFFSKESQALCFINQRYTLGWPPQWDPPDPSISMLWRYNLHYLEPLWELELQQAIQLTNSWIHFARFHPDHLAWDPYPTSLRLMNLCGVFFSRFRLHQNDEKAFLYSLWESLREQADWLCYHIEFHLMGNHLFENATALTLLGSLFRGPCGARWLAIGRPILKEQIQEQILPDGMHFERSPMYHTRIIYLMLLLAQQGEPQIATVARERLPSMLRAMQHLSHPDGDITLFNDSAFGIYPTPRQLLTYAQALDIYPTSLKQPDDPPVGVLTSVLSTSFLKDPRKHRPKREISSHQTASPHRSTTTDNSSKQTTKKPTPEHPTSTCSTIQQTNVPKVTDSATPCIETWSLPDAGYYGILQKHPQVPPHYLICDVGPIGPDYIPGHAHGDMLSFELSLFGQRVFVDSGVFDYVESKQRRYCRSTRAHNTVVIEDTDQSEFWGAFRVGHRARILSSSVLCSPQEFVLEAAHDGYKRLPQSATHKRRFRWQPHQLVITDNIEAHTQVRIELLFHLHPLCQVLQPSSHDHASIQIPGQHRLEISFQGPGALTIVEGLPQTQYYPGFSTVESNQALCFHTQGRECQISTILQWSHSEDLLTRHDKTPSEIDSQSSLST